MTPRIAGILITPKYQREPPPEAHLGAVCAPAGGSRRNGRPHERNRELHRDEAEEVDRRARGKELPEPHRIREISGPASLDAPSVT
jgi:hypothetical protein